MADEMLYGHFKLKLQAEIDDIGQDRVHEFAEGIKEANQEISKECQFRALPQNGIVSYDSK